MPAASAERFRVQRARSSDWDVIDTRANIPIAAGLDFGEAQKTAEARNKRRGKKKTIFSNTVKEGGQFMDYRVQDHEKARLEALETIVKGCRGILGTSVRFR